LHRSRPFVRSSSLPKRYHVTGIIQLVFVKIMNHLKLGLMST